MTDDQRPQPGARRQAPRRDPLPAAGHGQAPSRSLLLEITTRVIYPSVLVVALYLLFAGADRTGGGFTAGLVIGAGLALRFLAGGPHEFGTAVPVNPAGLLGAGLATMAGYGLLGILGDGALSSVTWKLDLGVLGHATVSSALVFDLGVALLVVGLVVDVLRVMGPGLAPDERQADEDAP